MYAYENEIKRLIFQDEKIKIKIKNALKSCMSTNQFFLFILQVIAKHPTMCFVACNEGQALPTHKTRDLFVCNEYNNCIFKIL